ncbi:3-carboxyethylcatechol 2,3-dioxygenase [Janibacter anophelis]|uniref:3-carboxyethylcatechol 2,3-dioxygenase n=1 Tax=Janibacter anophelis TaxID=319054 RepID=UPI0008351498|nr:3-carboxyethylcatechol 2,3-dioxygenase [Janibacter anophelis]
MSLSLVAMSHTPLLHRVEVEPQVRAEVDGAFEAVRAFVAEVDPELVITIGPDHYNGFFYDTMPPFCLGLAAHGLGDYGTATGDLDVPGEVALDLAQRVQASDIDLTISRAMGVDHGAVQPLEVIFGRIDSVPTIPLFVNCVAAPFVPMRRIRALGEAIGRWAAYRPERILVIASGGLSHDPPVPQWATASPEVRAGLLAGRNPTPQARAAREQRVVDTAREFAAGRATILDLNPTWDHEFLTVCREGEVASFDRYETDEMAAVAGNSSHEVRTWVTAFSALAAAGDYVVEHEYYRPIPEFIAGFGVMTARTKESLA